MGVIHPLAPLKLRWDSFVGIVLMLCLILTPYQICFERRNHGPFTPVECLNLSMDMVFLRVASTSLQHG